MHFMLGRMEALQGARQRLRGGGSVWILAVGLALNAAALIATQERPAGAARPAEAGIRDGALAEAAGLAAVKDPVYERFLEQYEPLRDSAEGRRYLAAQVLAAAGAHDLDPDLLFALIAAESGFNTHAVSAKGARGLGQMKFSTAHAAAPLAVRRPQDLHDIPRAAYATAAHLRHLLDRNHGDVRQALRAYYAGPSNRTVKRADAARYIGLVLGHYAYLKVRRMHARLAALGAGTAGATPN